MTDYVITFQGFAAPHSGPSPIIGSYLSFYNPEAYGGVGEVEWSTHQDRALRFDSLKEALDCWQTVPSNHPIRHSDGKPNRPLTSCTVEVITLPNT